MRFKRIDNGHYLCTESAEEFMSTWRFGINFNVDLNDLEVLNKAKLTGIDYSKECAIEFAKARKIYGDYVYMYPVKWLKIMIPNVL